MVYPHKNGNNGYFFTWPESTINGQGTPQKKNFNNLLPDFYG